MKTCLRFIITNLLFTMLLKQESGFCQESQPDSIIHIKTVTVTSNRLAGFSAGTKITTFDSIIYSKYIDKNLADLLADESPVFVKSYGMGSLASTSFRGGNASHTAVLWNGFNINSPMYGQTDLALVPVTASESVSLQFGSSTALWGSGAVGGAIHLNNYAKYDIGVKATINLSAGSFNSYRQQLNVELSKKRFLSVLKMLNASAKNNFEYNNIYAINTSSEKRKQTNATFKNYGLVSENYFKIDQNQEINLMLWLQQTEREIPPTMLQEINRSEQFDNNYRFASAYKNNHGKHLTTIRAAFFNEKLKYEDATYNYSETSHASEFIIEVEDKFQLSKSHSVNAGVNNTYVSAITPNYYHQQNQNRTALFLLYSFRSINEKLNTSVSARQELQEKNFAPFTFSAGADYKITDYLLAKASVARVYRIPALNDLYWYPGGNPDLLSESGYAQEAGLKLNFTKKHFTFSSEATVFNRNMSDWILWLPGITFWSPQNIASVWSRGIETNNTIIVHVGKTNISFAVITNYVLSTNNKARYENDEALNKQLIYTPMYSGLAKATIEFNRLAISFRHNYTGYRYTSTDNTQYLKPYDLGSANISFKVKWLKTSATAYFQINNIWNKEYQLLLNRAMPLQNFEAGISFSFNNSNKTTTK